MDFELDEDHAALRALAHDLFAREASPERLAVHERSDAELDARLWSTMAEAGLLGVMLPEEYGGAGLGLGALAVVLEEQGRQVAPVPLWSASVAAMALARHGSPGQREGLLPGIATGTARLALAVEGYAGASACRAELVAGRWRVSGTWAAVPGLGGSARVLVCATTPDGPGLFLLAAPGADLPVTNASDVAGGRVTWSTARDTANDLVSELVLDRVGAEPVGEPGDGAVADVLRHAAVALASLQVGIAQGAVAIAADYLRGRHQFGRPLGSFQAVQHQLADCWIDVEAMRWTRWQAVLGIATPDAERLALVARWWSGQAGLDVVHRVQHLHGGIGVDVDYPIHRYFLRARQVATTLGGPASALDALGELLATSGGPR
ncbi:acyl-CoA dehydrogenase family protein [Nocardioides sp. W7]|uniref:acyl-CoA dehydrogenase family protein n=1 Tax=Nocardioides sp. W7 TaxID=2931390 RepID=UPI001FD40610|nr:acyl-CoA dehydrogenase family protein [Nocardioides sp. W7]